MGEFGEFGDIIKRLREASHLTQEQESKLVHISRSNIAMYETGTRKPSKKTLEAFADFYNVDIDYLLGRTDKITRLPESNYYINPETAKIAQQIYDDPDLHALFDAAADSDPEDMQMAADLLRRLKKTNPDG